jgi:hypothetical protein
MEKFCIFCGNPPTAKNKEHVIPRWLIEATGNPKRIASFGVYYPNPDESKASEFSFDQFTFPACEVCNGKFSSLEGRAKPVVLGILDERPLSEWDFSVLLDWLDKVRVGLWLGLIQLSGNPWGITPSYHIAHRMAARDRSVGICMIKDRQPGINFVGPESPCFAHYPTTMALLINRFCLFNCSGIDLCSRRLGFPFPAKYYMREDRLLEVSLVPGLERILKPVERTGELQSFPFLYQPIFVRGDVRRNGFPDLYDTEYVRRNTIDYGAGYGGVFLQKPGSVSRYSQAPSDEWIPSGQTTLREAYRITRRSVYKKLEMGLEREFKEGRLQVSFFKLCHRRLIRTYESVL